MAFRWRNALPVARRLAVAAGAGCCGSLGADWAPVQMETSLEERVRTLETKIRVLEMNDLEEVRDLWPVNVMFRLSGTDLFD